MSGIWKPAKRNHSPDSNNLKGKAVWCARLAENTAAVLVVALGNGVCHTRLVLPNHFMWNGAIVYYQSGALHGTHSFDKAKSKGTNRSTNCVNCDFLFIYLFCLCRRRGELKGRGHFNTSSFVHCRNESCQLSLSPG